MSKAEKNTSRSETHLKNNNSIGCNAEFLSRGLLIKCFPYLTPRKNSPVFSFTRDSLKASNNALTPMVDFYNLFLVTIIPEDNGAESTSFSKTIDSIIKNADSLNAINISFTRVLHVLFIKNINQKETYDHFYPSSLIQSQIPSQSQAQSQLPYQPQSLPQSQSDTFRQKTDEFKCAFMEYEYTRGSTLPFLVINKQDMSDMEALECFYLHILEQLKSKETTVNIAQIDNGIIVPSLGLKELLSLCNVKSIAAVPSIETVPTGFLANIEHYANYQYNIYNLTYYSMSCSIPLNHLMFVMKANSSVMENIKMYFQSKINADSSIDYHDFQFSLFLYNQGYNIQFARNIVCQMPRTLITFPQFLKEQTNRMGGTFASALELGKLWKNCSMEDHSCANKLSLTFLLIGLIFDFMFPSMFSIAIYSIFHEAFDTPSHGSSLFFTGVYLLLVVLAISFSLSTRRNGDLSQKVFFSLYIAFVIFYYFVLICSIPAMHYVNINKTNDSYTFDAAAMAVLIVINIIFGFVPLLMNIKTLFSNIVAGLEYLVLGPHGSTSLLLNFAIVTCTDMVGTIKWDNLQRMSDAPVEQDRKGLLLVIYGIINGAFLCIILGLNSRGSRAGGVLALAIIYTIYNICKTFIIIAALVKSPKTVNVKDDMPLDDDNENEVVGNKRVSHNIMMENRPPLELGTPEENEPHIKPKQSNHNDDDDEMNQTGCLPANNIQLDKDEEEDKKDDDNYAAFGKDKDNGNTKAGLQQQIQYKGPTKGDMDQVKEKSIELEFDDNDE